MMISTGLLLFTLAMSLVQTSSATPPPAASVRPCGSNLLEVLAAVGWAFAIGRAPRLASAPPCSPQTQIPPAKEPERRVILDEPEPSSRLAKLPANEALRQARLLFIRPRSSRFNKEKLERELLKYKEFRELGLELTRSAPRAELILEITRKRFTTRFTCSMLEPASQRVLGAATASSLGGEIEPHLAEAILKQFKAAHGQPTRLETKP